MAATQVSERVQIDLQEYQQMRQEINNRTQISNTLLLGLGLALGTGLTLVASYPEALLGTAVVTSFLWVLYLDHTESIFKTAAYIVLVLSDRLHAVSTAPLGWELFRRKLESANRATSWAVLHPRANSQDERAIPDAFAVPSSALNINWFVGAVFLGLPLVLMVAYVTLAFFAQMDFTTPIAVRWLALGTAVVFLGWAIHQTLHVAHSLKTIETALSEYESQMGEPTATTSRSKHDLASRR